MRTYNKSMPLTEAVDQAVDECVEDGVLEEFLSKHRREVRNMVLTEFDEEKFLKMVREEERAEGRAEGRAAGLSITSPESGSKKQFQPYRDSVYCKSKHDTPGHLS